MKKQEMIDTLTKQGQDIKKELVEMQQTFTVKKEMLNRIEGALEALSALEPDEPPAPPEPAPRECRFVLSRPAFVGELKRLCWC